MDSIGQRRKKSGSPGRDGFTKMSGRDLSFLKGRGPCATLGGKRCFNANSSGVMPDTLDMIQKNLDTRWKEHPRPLIGPGLWLTVLVSAAAGPIILLLLGLEIRPHGFCFHPYFIKAFILCVFHSVHPDPIHFAVSSYPLSAPATSPSK